MEHRELGEGRGAVPGSWRPLAERLAPLLPGWRALTGAPGSAQQRLAPLLASGWRALRGTPGSAQQQLAPLLAPIALCFVALALRLWGLGDKPLWTDEAFTWFDYRHSLGEIVGARLNVHPPLYGVLMWAWMPIAGQSEYALRLPSALLSALAIPAVWRLGLRLGGHPTALVAALTMTVTPVGLAYAREARMYGPLMSQSALALLVADRLGARPTVSRWIALGAACAVGVLTHYTAVAAWAAAALVSWRSRRRSLITHSAVALVTAAWALVLWRNRDAWANLVWLPWTGRTRLRDMAVDWLSSMAGLPAGPNGPDEATSLQLVGIVLFGVALAMGLVSRRWPLILLALAPPIAMALLEFQRPGWHIRFVLVGMPAALLLAAYGATWLRGRLWPVSALLAAGLLSSQLAGFWAEWRRPVPQSWRTVAAVVRDDPTTAKVALGGVGSLASYYLQPILPTHQRPVAIGRPPEEVAADLDRAIAGAAVVWVVPRVDPLMDPGDLVGTLLSRYATRREERELGGLPVARLDLRPGSRIALGPPLRPVAAVYGEAVSVSGYAADRAADSLALSIEMGIERRLLADFKLFAHLLDAQGQTIAQRDVVLLDTSYRTTSQMDPGTRLRLELTINGAPDVIARGRAVGIGLYEAAGAGARLALAPPAAEHRLVLAID